MKYKEVSFNIMAFISCRLRLTKVLADVSRGREGGRKVRVGELERGYPMLIPGDCQDVED